MTTFGDVVEHCYDAVKSARGLTDDQRAHVAALMIRQIRREPILPLVGEA